MDLETFKNYFDVKINNINKNPFNKTLTIEFLVEHKIKKFNKKFSLGEIEEGRTQDEIINSIWDRLNPCILEWGSKAYNNDIGQIYNPIKKCLECNHGCLDNQILHQEIQQLKQDNNQMKRDIEIMKVQINEILNK